LPAIDACRRLSADNYQLTRDVTAWMDRMNECWNNIRIEEVETPEVGANLHVGQRIPVNVKVYLGDLSPDDITVEIVSGPLSSQEQISQFEPLRAELTGGGENGVWSFAGEITCTESGRVGVTARIIPHNENLPHTIKPKMISWW